MLFFYIFVFMINRVRNTVLSIINKDNNGYITPDEFNLFATQAQLERFEEYFSDYTLAIQKLNAHQNGSGYADTLKRCEDVIDYFTIPELPLVFDGSGFPLPSDLYKLERLNYVKTRNIEKISQNKANLLLFSNLTPPSLVWPYYSISGNVATVYPSSIDSNVTANYIRYPLTPKWTYVVAAGADAPLFNISASDYQDFELPISDEMNLIVRILQMAGISIREEQVVQAAKAEEIQDKQER